MVNIIMRQPCLQLWFTCFTIVDVLLHNREAHKPRLWTYQNIACQRKKHGL